MSANPLQSMGFWRGFEGAIEIAVPMTVAGIVFFRIKGLMEQVSMGRSLTALEVFVLLGAMTAVISWAVSRQMFEWSTEMDCHRSNRNHLFLWCGIWTGKTVVCRF